MKQRKAKIHRKTKETDILVELNLDKFQLALLTPDNNLLDKLEEEYGRNCQKPLATQILERRGFPEYKYYL